MNRTLYHAVTCSASGAKPAAVIRWEISGALPRDDIFSVNMINPVHPNGTTNSISVLRFPLIMNNESTVTCVVEHPAFTEPKRANIEVDTFGKFCSVELGKDRECKTTYATFLFFCIG